MYSKKICLTMFIGLMERPSAMVSSHHLHARSAVLEEVRGVDLTASIFGCKFCLERQPSAAWHELPGRIEVGRMSVSPDSLSLGCDQPNVMPSSW